MEIYIILPWSYVAHIGVGKTCALEIKVHCTTFDFPNAEVKSKFVKQFGKLSTN